MATNLSFSDKYDHIRFQTICEDMRKIAETWPAYDRAMAMVEDYARKIGPWQCRFMLEVWDKPVWHGSLSIVEEIGWRTEEMDNGWKFEVPQDALLSLTSWEAEHFEQARFILSNIFGPILRPGDDHQPALESKGLFTLSWHVPYEGAAFWKKRLH